MKSLAQKIEQLSPEIQQELEHFLNLLLHAQKNRSHYKLRQKWAGSLKDLKNQYSSLELQKKILDPR